MIGYTAIDKEAFAEYANKEPKWTEDHWSDYFYSRQNTIKIHASEKERIKDPLVRHEDRAMLFRLIEHLSGIGQKLEVYMADGFAAIVGYNGMKFVLPSELVKTTPLKDYSDISGESMKMLGQENDGLMALMPAAGESVSSVIKEKAETEDKLQALKAEKKAIEDGTSKDGELAALKAELDAVMEKMQKRQKELLAELRKKQDELTEKKEELEKEIFILETQIYGIRCYLGEVVSFHTIREGKPAPEELPIVIYQKVRFLDEELGKYLCLFEYGNHKDDKEQLLDALKHRDDIADILCPGPKSISAVKVSRSGSVKGASEDVANRLEDYALYHENQLAVLIRNGGQIHIAWLDADKIHISDDNIFYRPGAEESHAEEEDKNEYRAQIHKENSKRERREILSRWFFFSVLQGVLDNTGLISIPEKVKVMDMHSPWLCYSLAEGWIATDRYGSFRHMLEKSTDIPLREGDYIMTGMRVSRDDRYEYRDNRWNNNRGIGDKNRTSGVSLPPKKIIRVNKVIPGIRVRYKVRVYKARIEIDPKGTVIYRYPRPYGGFFEQSYPEKDRDDATLVYRPEYNAVLTKDEVRTEEFIEVISGDDWHSYGTGSYRKLTDSQLKRLSGIHEDRAYKDIPGEKAENSIYDLDKAYKLQESGTGLCCKEVIEAKILGEVQHQYYCSVKQNGWRGGWNSHETEYNVNFQFYPHEVIPLPFLCSSWVRSIVSSGSIGGYCLCGAAMGYADMLPYLQKILVHLQEREKEEKEMIVSAGGKEWLEAHPEWDAELCEWKIENRVHVLTPTRAKKFLKNKNPL